MVYTHDLKLCLARDEGSSPSSGTMNEYYKEVLQTPDHKRVTRIIDTINKIRKTPHERATMDFPDLLAPFDEDDRKYIHSLLKINPHEYGFEGQYFGLQPVPGNIRPVPESYGEQLLPEPVLVSFQNMNTAMQQEIGKKIVIFSGYRSPAYQTIVFLWNLRANNFDVAKTLKSVAIPGYSEHGAPDHQAIDVMTEGDTPNTGLESKFATTKEYAWLLENAARYGFFESYPKDNKSGIVHEPWHWHYEAPDSKK